MTNEFENPENADGPESPSSGGPWARPTEVTGEGFAGELFTENPEHRDPSAHPGEGEGGAGNRVKRRGRGLAVAGVAGALVLGLLGAGAAFAWQKLNGSTDQPEDHLPASTVAFAKIDLDPSAAQKVDLLRFAAKFADSAHQGKDPRELAYESARRAAPSLPPYSSAKQWLGSRLAIALFSDGTRGVPVVLVQVTDESKAQADLAGLEGAIAVVKGGWAYLSDTSADANAAAANTSSLSTNSLYRKDVKDLGDDGIASSWFDLSAASKLTDVTAVPNVTREQLATALPAGSTEHGILALRFDGTALELRGRIHGVTSGPAVQGGTTDVATLPKDSMIAFAVNGLGDQIAAQWDGALKELTKQGLDPQTFVDEAQQQVGLSLPQDLEALGGQRLAVFSTFADGQALRWGVKGASNSPDLERILGIVTSSLTSGEPSVEYSVTSGGYTVGSGQDVLAALGADGGLGGEQRFKDAVPRASQAGSVGYLNLAAIMDRGASMTVDDPRKHLDAAGFSLEVSGTEVSLTVRLTTR